MDQDSQESDVIAVSQQDLALEQYFDSMLNYFTTINTLNKSTLPSFKRTLLDAIKKYEKKFDGVSTSVLSDVERTADPKAVKAHNAENNNQNTLNLLDDTSVTQMNTDDDNDTNTITSIINEENNAENILINETSTDPNQGPNVVPIQSENMYENNEGALDVALALPSVQVEEVDVQMLAVTTEGATDPVIADTAVEDALQASQEIIEEGEELEEGELESNASEENEVETKFKIMSRSVECVVKLLRDNTKSEIVDEKYMRDTLNLHTSDDIIGFVESAIGEYLLNEKFVLSLTDLVIHSPDKNALTVELANQLWKESFKKYIDLKKNVPADLVMNISTEPARFFDANSELGAQKIRQIRDQERRQACTKLMCQLYIHSYVEVEIFVTYVYALLRDASNQNILYCLCELLEMTGKFLETFLQFRYNFLVLNEKKKIEGSQFMNLVFGQMDKISKMAELHETVRWKVNELIYCRNNDWKEKDKFGHTNYSITSQQVPSTSRRIVLESPSAGPSAVSFVKPLKLPPVHSESAIQPVFPTNEVTVTMQPSFQELAPNKNTNFGSQGNKNRRGKGNNTQNNRKIKFDPKYGYLTQRDNAAFIQSQQDEWRTQIGQQNPKRKRPNKNNKQLNQNRKRPNKRQNLMNATQRNVVNESANWQENSLMKIKNLQAQLKRTQKQLMLQARLSNASSNPI